MSSRVISCTGSAVSLSMRLIDEPVISTRCIFGASCAQADWPIKPSAAATADARTVFDICFICNAPSRWVTQDFLVLLFWVLLRIWCSPTR
jgi:hypothetical protein